METRTERQSDKREEKKNVFRAFKRFNIGPPGLRDALLSIANSK
jgi:hypothetical protein